MQGLVITAQFPDSRELFKNDYLIPFEKDEFTFLYDYQRHLQEMT